ncbi:uncharacterized protein IWZ02DRAFT_487005 [Phyllosticta citriasiana]|uniref:uncharacterized protein n=1 Tax=Phyllosticta citriasiana TaxID=595635 RepID=UPI0030FDF437
MSLRSSFADGHQTPLPASNSATYHAVDNGASASSNDHPYVEVELFLFHVENNNLSQGRRAQIVLCVAEFLDGIGRETPRASPATIVNVAIHSEHMGRRGGSVWIDLLQKTAQPDTSDLWRFFFLRLYVLYQVFHDVSASSPDFS